MQTRDLNIDILMAVAMLCVVLAHCSPPGWLSQLRNFDVPLLVLLSGMAFSGKYENGIENTKKFIFDRVLKLVIPVWSFFVLYFIFYYFLTFISPLETLSLQDIVGTFSFYWGIGYVWIIRIFLLICLITPWILNLNKNLPSKNYWLWVIGAYIFYEGLVFIVQSIMETNNFSYFLTDILLINIPYICLFALGVKIKTFSSKAIMALTGSFGLVFFGIAALLFYTHQEFIPTQDFKYPPQIYYISFALAASFCLIVICNFLKFPEKISNILQWISKNSLWIYLWHIMGLLTFDALLSDMIPKNWLVVFTYVFVFSVLMVWGQSLYVSFLNRTPQRQYKTILKRILS